MIISADTKPAMNHYSFSSNKTVKSVAESAPTVPALLPRRLCLTFLLGAAAYPCLEIAFRGYSHWTMSLAGGLCFALLYAMEAEMPDLPFWMKAAAGALIITAVELATGTVVNLWLGWAVWDYSNLRFHFLGQVSLIFAAIWYALCCLFFTVADLVRRMCSEHGNPGCRKDFKSRKDLKNGKRG